MDGFKFYRKKDIESFISKRKAEIKFGEKLQFVESFGELNDSPATYVLLGLPEDIGVRANHGKTGASAAWKSALKSLVNIQVNRYNHAENLILLGELDTKDLMEKASWIDESDPNYHIKLGDLVKKIDQLVADLMENIISSGKIPIVIGGGHNNAYGNIKGAAKALKNPVNIINIDAHTDLRQLEHRHSGNGFSYAIEGGYLQKYTVFGLHKNYTPEYIFQEMEASDNLNFQLAEDLLEYPNELSRNFKKSLEGIKTGNFGFELDCDAIAGFPSSAKSPSGFTIDQVRNFIQIISKNTNCCYFHICEAAPESQEESQVGKALSYFISDFIGS